MCWPRRSSPMPLRCGGRTPPSRDRALLLVGAGPGADRARHRARSSHVVPIGLALAASGHGADPAPRAGLERAACLRRAAPSRCGDEQASRRRSTLLAVDRDALADDLRARRSPRARAPADRCGARPSSTRAASVAGVSSGKHRHGALRDDRPGIHLGAHEMHRRAVDCGRRPRAPAACVWRPGKSGSREGWMLMHPVAPRLDEAGREQPHEAGEADELDAAPAQRGVERASKSAFVWKDRVIDDRGRDPSLRAHARGRPRPDCRKGRARSRRDSPRPSTRRSARRDCCRGRRSAPRCGALRQPSRLSRPGRRRRRSSRGTIAAERHDGLAVPLQHGAHAACARWRRRPAPCRSRS